MRKLVLVCAAIMAVTTISAQKKNVNKAKFAFQAATADAKNINYEKLNEAWTLIEPAMTDSISTVMPDTWYYAGKVRCVEMNKILSDRAANGGQMDMDKFFDNQYDIVTFFSKCDKYEHTPDAKGRLPKTNRRAEIQQLATGPRTNLLIAASNLVNTDANRCVKFLDLYFASFTDSLFHGMNLEKVDTMRYDAYFIYATALKSNAKTPEDTTKVMNAMEKALASNSYAKNACFELMQIYKSRGQHDKWAEYCNMGVERFPDEPMFTKVMLVENMENKKWDEALRLCDLLIQRYPSDEWAFYNKALVYFQQEKFKEALDAFIKTTEIKSDYADAWVAAGKAAWKLAQDNESNKDKSITKNYYTQAIECFETARQLEPEKPDLWGYSLYACYNNSGNLAKAKEFKQYNK